MAYVNYLREHMAFIERASDLNLNGNERTFWYALIHIANQRANGSDWPEDFISVPNKRLLALVPFGEKNIPALRNRLRQAGLIEFRTGERNKRAPEYKILYLTAELSTETPQNAESYRKNDGKNEGNRTCKSVGKGMGNGWDKAVGNGGNLNVNLNVTPNVNPNMHTDDDDAAAAERARAAMENRVRMAFREEMGREALPAEVRSIVLVAINIGMEEEVVVQAIAKSAIMHARNPAAYVIEVIREWNRKEIHTVYDLVDSREMM